MIRVRHWILAIALLRRHDPSVGIDDGQELVFARARALDVPIDAPDPTLEDVLSRASVTEHAPVLVVEALWDGDTVHDWFVCLVTVHREADGGTSERRIAVLTGGAAAARATSLGRRVADRLGAPFSFASPNRPDDRAPRWRAD